MPYSDWTVIPGDLKAVHRRAFGLGGLLTAYIALSTFAALIPFVEFRRTSLLLMQFRIEDVGIAVQCSLIAFWASLGSTKPTWKALGTVLAVAALTAQHHLYLTCLLGLGLPATFPLGIPAAVLVSYVAFSLAFRWRVRLERVDRPTNARLQFSIFGMMHAISLLALWHTCLFVMSWIKDRYYVHDLTYAYGAVFSVLAAWAALSPHRPWLPVLSVGLLGLLICERWITLAIEDPSLPFYWNHRGAETLILLMTFLALRYSGFRLVPRSSHSTA